jgi:hypothetical protein
MRSSIAVTAAVSPSSLPFSVVGDVMGWSSATTIRMAKRYGHIGQPSLRSAVNSIATAAARLPQKSEKQPGIQVGSFDNPFTLDIESDGMAVN